jgi:uncharacterized protein (UPF0332 family)
MSFPEDLLQQAYDLAAKEPGEPKQASLRRAVSTAYYALFHLLIDEAVGKWAVERQRSRLARTFEHDGMKRKCAEVVKRVNDGAHLPVELNTVAHNFVQLQEHRHTADYDNSMRWSRADVSIVLTLATDAFDAWSAIGAQDDAQDFLLQLLFPKLPRQ